MYIYTHTYSVAPTVWERQTCEVFYDVVGSIVAQVFMSKRCNKCGQGDPHLSDTWCLACTAVEAITGELRLAWGTGGTRALATDLLVSATRQVRALRRLGIAGGGRSRPASPARAVLPAAAGEGAGRAATPAPEPPPPPPHPKAAVKEEDADSSEYTEDTGEPSGEGAPTARCTARGYTGP